MAHRPIRAAAICTSVCFFAIPALVGAAAPQEIYALTSCRQIRSLTREEAQRGYPVHLRAVVTYFDPIGRNWFLQDSTGGMFIQWSLDMPKVAVGDLLDLEGVSTQVDFAPDIAHPHWKVIGRAPLPAPRRVSFGQMANTSEDATWVEVEGIARSAAYVRHDPGERVLDISLALPGGNIDVRLPWDGAPVPSQFVDAQLRIRGVCGASFTPTNQMVGVVLFVPSLNQISVVEPTKFNPFAAPATSVGNLQRFGLGSTSGHRVKVAAVVTAVLHNGGIYVKDPTGSIYVETTQDAGLKPGDRIEALGFPGFFEKHVRLEDAVIRRTGTGREPTPVALTMKQAMTGQYDSALVSLEGRVVRESSLSSEALFLKQAHTLFSASFPPLTPVGKLPRAGSRVQVTGICVTQTDPLGHVLGLRLIIRSADGILVLEGAPWWTTGRALIALAALAFSIALTLAWIVILRVALMKKPKRFAPPWKQHRTESWSCAREARSARSIKNSRILGRFPMLF
jgi:hypothetical protein